MRSLQYCMTTHAKVQSDICVSNEWAAYTQTLGWPRGCINHSIDGHWAYAWCPHSNHRLQEERSHIEPSCEEATGWIFWGWGCVMCLWLWCALSVLVTRLTFQGGFSFVSPVVSTLPPFLCLHRVPTCQTCMDMCPIDALIYIYIWAHQWDTYPCMFDMLVLCAGTKTAEE